MTETLHDPRTVERVVRKLVELRNPLTDIEKLTEDQLADWTAQAIEMIEIVHEVPTEGVAFLDELQHAEDYLEPWRDVFSVNDRKPANVDVLSESSNDPPMLLVTGGAGGGKTVTRIDPNYSEDTSHMIIAGRNGGFKNVARADTNLRLVAEVEESK